MTLSLKSAQIKIKVYSFLLFVPKTSTSSPQDLSFGKFRAPWHHAPAMVPWRRAAACAFALLADAERPRPAPRVLLSRPRQAAGGPMAAGRLGSYSSVVSDKHGRKTMKVDHRIHGAGIYANIGGILMVNVTIYSIHGSYGVDHSPSRRVFKIFLDVGGIEVAKTVEFFSQQQRCSNRCNYKVGKIDG